MGIDYAHLTGDRFREVKKSGPGLAVSPVWTSRPQVQCSSQGEMQAGLILRHLKDDEGWSRVQRQPEALCLPTTCHNIAMVGGRTGGGCCPGKTSCRHFRVILSEKPMNHWQWRTDKALRPPYGTIQSPGSLEMILVGVPLWVAGSSWSATGDSTPRRVGLERGRGAGNTYYRHLPCDLI